jgi:hypothetical protein
MSRDDFDATNARRRRNVDNDTDRYKKRRFGYPSGTQARSISLG